MKGIDVVVLALLLVGGCADKDQDTAGPVVKLSEGTLKQLDDGDNKPPSPPGPPLPPSKGSTLTEKLDDALKKE